MFSRPATLKRQILSTMFLLSPWHPYLSLSLGYGVGTTKPEEKHNAWNNCFFRLKKKNYFLKKKDFDYLILLLFLTHISTEGKKREILSFPSTVDPLCLNFNLSINFFIELLIFFSIHNTGFHYSTQNSHLLTEIKIQNV